MNSHEIASMNLSSLELKEAHRPLSIWDMKLKRQSERTLALGWAVAEQVFQLQRCQIRARFDGPRVSLSFDNPGDANWLVAGRARLEERDLDNAEVTEARGLDDRKARAALMERAMRPIQHE